MQSSQPGQGASRYYPESTHNQAQHLMHIPAVNRRVTISLEDAYLEE